MLQAARERWRLDNLPTLEVLAHIQHYGGPTRLLDVTANPLIAAWFAVEQQYQLNGSLAKDIECRVFCFYVGQYVSLDQEWGGRDLPWENWHLAALAKLNDWGSGKVRRVWRPPAYNTRISAQNGAFLLDGVPFSDQGSNRFVKAPGTTTPKWSIKEIQDVSSIPIRLNDATRAPQTPQSTPAFTFRIAAEARETIRKRLESNYGYSTSSIYGDLFGLAHMLHPTCLRSGVLPECRGVDR